MYIIQMYLDGFWRDVLEYENESDALRQAKKFQSKGIATRLLKRILID